MLVYWSLLVWTTFVGLTWKKWFINKKSVLDNGEIRLNPTLVSMMFSINWFFIKISMIRII